ncbi:hypothetical protein HZC35_04450 [Candidatus Saganbacteria bacterium]|nr:hypothetical protein [Candidatus Saganbacteria bacterium]
MSAEEAKGINPGAAGRPAGNPRYNRGLDTDKLKEGLDGARRLAGAIGKYGSKGPSPAGDHDSDLSGVEGGLGSSGELPPDLVPAGVVV